MNDASQIPTLPFRADHVGSLLRPQTLLQARADFKEGKIPANALRAAEDSAIRDAIRLQEDVGLQSVTDGEFRREGWQWDFFRAMGGVGTSADKVAITFHNEGGDLHRSVSGLQVTGKLNLDHVIFGEHFAFLRAATARMPKLTIPAPSLLHRRGGASVVDPAIYPDIEVFWHDLAAVYAEEIAGLGKLGCTYLQLDDTSFAALCDPAYRASVATLGVDGASLHRTYIRLFNDSLAKRPAGMTICTHTCRGNHRSSWITSGGYDFIAEALFSELQVDGFFLEYDDDRSGGFEPLRFVPRGRKVVVLGLVTSKTGQMESKDELKRRIDAASKYLPLEQLALSPQCGFASTEEGNTLTEDEQWAKLRLCVEVAREVWGSV